MKVCSTREELIKAIDKAEKGETIILIDGNIDRNDSEEMMRDIEVVKCLFQARRSLPLQVRNRLDGLRSVIRDE